MTYIFKDFTKKFSLSKTLRFELKPIGPTLEHINKKGLISQDEERARSYKLMKKTIDDFHKYFIELALKDIELEGVQEYAELYFATKAEKQDEKYSEKVASVQTLLRKQIAKAFRSDKSKPIFDKLGKKELFTDLLVNWIKEKNPDAYFDEAFAGFTTYFQGFHKNRENMYSDKEQSTAIAYRLIHENLPKFLDNIKIVERMMATNGLKEKIDEVFTALAADIDLNGTDEVFTVESFSNFLIQRRIDCYNAIIGGKIGEDNRKIKGLNEHINEYNQKQKVKSDRIPKLKLLYKQILSDREHISFKLEQFEHSQELLESINNFYHYNIISFNPLNNDAENQVNTETIDIDQDNINILKETEKLLSDIADYNLEKIYLRNDAQLTTISQRIFGNYGVFKDALSYYYNTIINPKYESEFEKGTESKRNKLEKEKDKFVKADYISIRLLQDALNIYKATLDEELEITKRISSTCVQDYFHKHFKAEKREDTDKEFSLRADVEAKYLCIKGILENYAADKELYQDRVTAKNIKLFLDALMAFMHFVKPLILPGDSNLEKDEMFYGQLDPWYDSLKELIPLYNKVRNFVTRKPYSTEKFKLNFENKGNFLNGWVESRTDKSDNGTQYGGYLFRKKNASGEYDYYLGVSADVKLFRAHLQTADINSKEYQFERLNYYQLKSATVYGNSYQGSPQQGKNTSYDEDKRLLVDIIDDWAKKHDELYKLFEKHKKKSSEDASLTPSGLFNIVEKQFPNLVPLLLNDPNFKKENLRITNNLKNTILSLVRVPKAQEYKNVDFSLFTQPIAAIEELSKEKVFSYFPVSEEEMNDALYREKNPLFLFKITNKDLSFNEKWSAGLRKSKGKENLHTLYFKGLMNSTNGTIDIGTGEIFFRRKSIVYPERILEVGHHADELKNKFSYPIIKDKRYTYDKFLFHLSVKLNYQLPDKPNPKDFNHNIKEAVTSVPDIKIIGLDRGERHLIYLTMIDTEGKVVMQKSLNTVSYDKYNITTDYKTLLQNRESERHDSRKSWDEIQNIKELKEGYLSQVVYDIAKIMVENNAIVVMEDLNKGFKRSRTKVERQVYQKLERKLIEKLNYLVFKDTAPDQPGGLYNALQLTHKFESFAKLGKQCGFLFYVPPTYTSKIDPTTGFVNLFSIKYESIEKTRDFFQNFESIRYNPEKGYFEFAFDYRDFKVRYEGKKTKWTVCTYGDRIHTFRNPNKQNHWDSTKLSVTEKLEDLLGRYQIIYGDGSNIKDQICKQTAKGFFKELTELFRLTLQMRNSNSDTEEDYIISPVLNTQGYFYDSRNAPMQLPQDADANGAYHIAKKGLMWLEQIRKNSSETKKDTLDTSTNAWLSFAQASPFCPKE